MEEMRETELCIDLELRIDLVDLMAEPGTDDRWSQRICLLGMGGSEETWGISWNTSMIQVLPPIHNVHGKENESVTMIFIHSRRYESC